MHGNTPIEKVLRLAIRREKEAREFYLDLLGKVEEPGARDTLDFLAREELKHKEFLERYLSGGFQEGTLRLNAPVDYKIVEHMEDEPDAQADEGPLTPRRAFLIAARRESNSHAFYQELARIHPAGECRDLLQRMASEELRHKEKVEYLYTNTSFPQTAGG